MPRWDVTVTFEGPTTSTDNAAVRFCGTGGVTVQDSGLIISDCGVVSGGSISSGFGNIDNGTSNITSGGTWTVDVDATGTDGACLSAAGTMRFGCGQDLRIFHGGTNNYVTGVTGDLIIGTQGSSGGIILDAEDDTLEIKYSGAAGANIGTGG